MNALFEKARAFYLQYYTEKGLGSPEARLAEIREEIAHTGTYYQYPAELEFGVRLAWRNSNRCIGRLFWKTLKCRDERHIATEEGVFESLRTHLRTATNGGKIRPVITIFRPESANGLPPFQIWNTQLVRYAGYAGTDRIHGDPAEVAFTQQCESMGWTGKGSEQDILPVVIQKGSEPPVLFEFEEGDVLEVPILHPHYSWFEALGIRWYAVPVITSMVLEVGGIIYPAAPFNGWYMATEIASRNLGDVQRYNWLPEVAQRMGLDINQKGGLWKDRAMVELNEAVLYSFTKAGVMLVDHHTASTQFMHFCETEEKAGRKVQADWSWIVPPMSGSGTPVFHHAWSNEVISPGFFYRNPVWENTAEQKKSACPFHRDSLRVEDATPRQTCAFQTQSA